MLLAKFCHCSVRLLAFCSIWRDNKRICPEWCEPIGSAFQPGGCMKIRYQLLLCMIFLCLSFLTIEFLIFQKSFLIFVCITIGFYFFTTLLLYMFFVKRIEKLNKDLVDVQSNTSAILKTNKKSKDDFSEIITQINMLLDTIKLSRQQLNFLTETSEENVPLSMVNSKKFALTHLNESQHSGIKIHDRVYFNETLSKTISYIKRHNKLAVVLIIDIDITSDAMIANASLDEAIIIEVAKKFSKVLRNEDIFAKLDGNEFAILLNDVEKPKFASSVAEKLLQVITAGVEVDNKDVLLKASMGICIPPMDAMTLEEAIEKTYTALYRAKSMVGSHYQFYTKEIDAEAHEFAKMKGALQKAIKNNELVLHYQPKLNIKKGCVAGVEVLVRWLHPTLGLLSPDKFIDVAEDSGSIIAMSNWVLREACKINKYWQNEGYEHLTMALNVSKKQFFHPDFLVTLTAILSETKLNPNYLELEINEETIMEDLEKATNIMKQVSALGVQIAIDHFGTGYTSISHLKHLPVNTIKIDREFIKGVPFNPNDSAITSAMIAMAHYLGIYTLAEGVENSEQLQFLTEQQCDMVQGYYLSYPLPVDTVVQQFKKISDRALS